LFYSVFTTHSYTFYANIPNVHFHTGIPVVDSYAFSYWKTNSNLYVYPGRNRTQSVSNHVFYAQSILKINYVLDLRRKLRATKTTETVATMATACRLFDGNPDAI